MDGWRYIAGWFGPPAGLTRGNLTSAAQSIKVADAESGATVRKRMCVQCIRSGRVTRQVKKRLFSMQSV